MVAVPDPSKLPLLLHTRSKDTGNGTSIEELTKACSDIVGFKGVLMQDEVLPLEGCYIMNLDNSKGPGTHWVAVSMKYIKYFDPFGVPPPDKVKVKYYNSFEIQHAMEDLCGEYCIYFLKNVKNDMDYNCKLLLSMVH